LRTGRLISAIYPGQDTRRIPENPCHWSGYPQDTCKPLPLVRIPAGYLQTPATGQDTRSIPANPCHWSGYPQDTCRPLPLVRIPAGYLQNPSHWSGYEREKEGHSPRNTQ